MISYQIRLHFVTTDELNYQIIVSKLTRLGSNVL